jgi:hypothetical protein
MKKKVPKFKSEDEEGEFWATGIDARGAEASGQQTGCPLPISPENISFRKDSERIKGKLIIAPFDGITFIVSLATGI